MASYYRYPFIPNNKNVVKTPPAPPPVVAPLPTPVPPPVEIPVQEVQPAPITLPAPAPSPLPTQVALPTPAPMPTMPTPAPVQPAPVFPVQQMPPMQPCPTPVMPQMQPCPAMPFMPVMPTQAMNPCPLLNGYPYIPEITPPMQSYPMPQEIAPAQGYPMPQQMPPMQSYPMPQPIAPMQGYPMMDSTQMEDMYAMDEMDLGPATAAASDPPPVLSNNPAIQSVSLFKELTGYNNYGNPSGNADILYTGNRGAWTFDIPGNLFGPGSRNAQLVISAALDDHYNVPVNRYSASISINGTVVHNGPLPLEHGAPAGGRFNNWRPLVFNIRNLRRNNRVVIVNTSNTGTIDFVALDWMELRLAPRT